MLSLGVYYAARAGKTSLAFVIVILLRRKQSEAERSESENKKQRLERKGVVHVHQSRERERERETHTHTQHIHNQKSNAFRTPSKPSAFCFISSWCLSALLSSSSPSITYITFVTHRQRERERERERDELDGGLR